MANKYETRRFEPVNNAEYDFYEVSVNGKYLCQRFLDEIKEERDKKKLFKIYAYMDSFSSNFLPSSKFRQIKGLRRKDVYEFKNKDIRVYVLMKKPNIFVILGGYKGTQDKDINRIDNLFNDF